MSTPARLHIRRTATAAVAGIALTLAPSAALAAGNGNGNGKGPSHSKAQGKSQGKSQAKSQAKSQGKPAGQSQGKPAGTSQGASNGQGKSQGKSNGNAYGHSNGQAASGGSSSSAGGTRSGSQGSQGSKGSKGDPRGNNGTVKIENLGVLDRIPNNSPHVGCTFQIEWYGFDEGADVVSTVTFASHAPTRGTLAGVDGPSRVFVGGDPATGAGTDTGLDGRENYTLSFDGEPHPQQGYHVKLTVRTPRSQGNDTKTKVFWVQPCDEGTDGPGTEEPGTDEPGTDEPGTEEPGTDEPGTDEPGTDEPGTDEPGTDEPGTEIDGGTDEDDEVDVLGEEALTDTEVITVLGEQASAGRSALEVRARQATAVAKASPEVKASVRSALPTGVDAGLGGSEADASAQAGGPFALMLLGGMAMVAAARRRARA